jgi:hypothetical protein
MDKIQDLKISLLGGEQTGLIDFSESSLLSARHKPARPGHTDQIAVSAASIAFNPIFWK